MSAVTVIHKYFLVSEQDFYAVFYTFFMLFFTHSSQMDTVESELSPSLASLSDSRYCYLMFIKICTEEFFSGLSLKLLPIPRHINS